MERTQTQPTPRTFPAKPTCQRKPPNHEHRPPHQLEAANMVEHYKPFCRACRDFHEESGCHYACYVQEHGHPEGCGPSTSTSEPYYINNINDILSISKKNWPQTNHYEKKVDNLTQYYGEMPSAEQINNTQNFKGITYQRKARDGSSAQNVPKVTTPNIPK